MAESSGQSVANSKVDGDLVKIVLQHNETGRKAISYGIGSELGLASTNPLSMIVALPKMVSKIAI